MTALIKLDAARHGLTRKKGKRSVAGVYDRNNVLYVRKRIDGILRAYSTKKKNTPNNREWVEYHSETIWTELHQKASQEKVEEVRRSQQKTLEEFGMDYYSDCPDTRDMDSNNKLKEDFSKYVVPLLGHYHLEELTPSIIKKWQLKMKYYPDPIPDNDVIEDVKPRRGVSRMNNLRSALSQVLVQAVRDGLIASSPLQYVELKKSKSKRREISIKEVEDLEDEKLEDIFTAETVVYNEKEIQELIQTCDDIINAKKASRHRLVWKSFREMMIFKFYSGVRTGEAIALMWRNVDFENNSVDIRLTMRNGNVKLPKEDKTRKIHILPQAKEALRRLKELSGHSKWVFLGMQRKPYTNAYGPAKLWNQVLAKTTLKPARFYNTRHSFITNMLSRGLNTEWLTQQVGHESILITRKIYEGNIDPEWEKFEG